MKSEIAKIVDAVAAALNGSVTPPDVIASPFSRATAHYSILGRFKKQAVEIIIELYGELLIKLDSDSDYSFSVLPNTRASRLSIFSGRRVHAGHKEFDEAFVVRITRFPNVQSWLLETEILSAIRGLAPFKYLKLEQELLRYSSPCDLDHLSTDMVLAKAEVLYNIAASVARADR